MVLLFFRLCFWENLYKIYYKEEHIIEVKSSYANT